MSENEASSEVKMPKDKHTVPEERFTIDCSFCGFLTTERTYVAAMETAQRLKLRHKASDEKITIFDRLAQRGVCNTWDIDGHCIGYKEARTKYITQAELESERTKNHRFGR